MYNVELIQKCSYGDEIEGFGVIEEVDIQLMTVTTFNTIQFNVEYAIEGLYALNPVLPNYIITPRGLYNFADAKIEIGSALILDESRVHCTGIGFFDESTKSFNVTGNVPAIIVEDSSENTFCIFQSSNTTQSSVYNFSTGTFQNSNTNAVFCSKIQAVNIFNENHQNSLAQDDSLIYNDPLSEIWEDDSEFD